MNIKDLYELGIAYAKSYSSFYLNGKPQPFSAAFMVTNKCNLRCSYCNYPLIKSKELSLEEINLLFDKLLKIGIKRLGISGGEPMVRKDLPEILDLAKSKGFFINLNSNLLLYDRFKDKLNSVDYFFTSIDGDAKMQKMNRGNDDLDKIISAIREIKSRGKKISVISVISKPDISTIDYLLSLAVREQFDLHFQPEGYGAELLGRTNPVEDNNESYREVWKYIYQQKKAGLPITSSKEYLKYIAGWDNYAKTAISDSKFSCSARYSFIFIDPTGTVYPCCYTKGKVKGINLLEEEWDKKNFESLPCSTCIGGPYLEHNLLFRKPIQSSISAIRKAF